MAKKKAKKLSVSTTQLVMFGLMLVGSVALLMLNVNYPEQYSVYYSYAGAGLFVLAVLYFYLIRYAKKAK
jgi:hypothetical protein